MPPGASGESQCTCARGPTSGVLPRSGILSAAPKHGILVPIADAFARILPCGAAWARTPHDTCSPTWSGIGSDKDPTLDPPLLVIKPREEDLTPGTVKPVQVSLVEPVAYQFSVTPVLSERRCWPANKGDMTTREKTVAARRLGAW